ncbi:cation-translocating P-type ATPase [Ktedonospora formicarum]|uniref:P-type Cu(+) transporter n=1 Tax=Ktedonospora formicarum TaxID=2778364 RepID=A0A8J3MTX9_9CHLR|nr:HAD-IC family P-type ATPase [Ktedonospora formicarum]GHO46063.1 hypothetical protein KSX_42260 [Ktedonospora formicarum]
MNIALAEESQIVHSLPGRLRVHLPHFMDSNLRPLEVYLHQLEGIQGIRANTSTQNVLILYDPALLDEQAILASLAQFDLHQMDKESGVEKNTRSPSIYHEKTGETKRVHITVRGLNRDPHVANSVLEVLAKYPNIHARLHLLTGRVLIEYAEHQTLFDDLISEISDVELPELPDEDRPSYPLDPGPLVQSVIRTIGSIAGGSVLAFRSLFGMTEPLPGTTSAIHIASVISILQGIPPLRHGLRKLVGRTTGDLLLNIPSIITLTLGNSALGLVTIGCESLRLLTEVYRRRGAWHRYEEQEAAEPILSPGTMLQLASGEKVPLVSQVLEGSGIGILREGIPLSITSGSTLPPGCQLYGGPFLIQIQHAPSFQAFQPKPHPVPPALSPYDRYFQILAPLSLLYAAGTAILTRSFSQTLASLVLVNARPAVAGAENADLAASTYVLNSGVVVVGTRKHRTICLPQMVMLDGARVLTDGLELADIFSLSDEISTNDLLTLAANMSSAAGSPWGSVFKQRGPVQVSLARFDGSTIQALTPQGWYKFGPIHDFSRIPDAFRQRHRGAMLLALYYEQSQGRSEQLLGVLALRPRLVPDIPPLVRICKSLGVELLILTSESHEITQAIARRAEIPLCLKDDVLAFIREKQAQGARVAFVSDNADTAAAFDACDLAIGLMGGQKRFYAQADLLAPDFQALTAIIIAGAKREATARDSLILSCLSNIVGIFWGWRGAPGIMVASRVVYLATLSTLAEGWLRFRGPKRAVSSLSRLSDPHPERWGQQSIEQVMQSLHSSKGGLTSKEATLRQHHVSPHTQRNRLLLAALDQLRSPLNVILGAGAIFSLLLGAGADVGIIGATILANVGIGIWQEHKSDKMAQSLQRLGSTNAHILRDGRIASISANEVVTGDILSLAPGDRIAADARVIEAQGLEVDEALLTGESFPVEKHATEGTENTRIVLAGSDVTTGTGKALVVAVGDQTRMGGTTVALAADETEQSPLGTRLARMLQVLLPVSILGGGFVIVTGLVWGQPLKFLLATGASIALAGVPEGLPLLAKVGEAGVAHRLENRDALVRRLSAVEALGRVDTVCTDKTGTLTKGQLELSMVADATKDANLLEELSRSHRYVLTVAALACPHPNAPDARAHPTDYAIIEGALSAGLARQICVAHDDELAFDPVRSFSATLAQGRIHLKGAPEALLARCTWVYVKGLKLKLNETRRHALLERAHVYARRGLRVLMVAESSVTTSIEDPQALVCLGFVAISDPLRSTVHKAVHRCQEAGVRVMMITGDHPATARAIAEEAGLFDGGEILTGEDVTSLSNEELGERLEHASIIARTTPLNKLRIIECLRERGHTVAMTGDGVNDAPALRFADVGMAMGVAGTEVARQTADVVIMNDDLLTLVESFVEGRSFWRNIRRALGLLLGGNLGELGLVVGASALGLGMPLTVRQILAMNAITDILPALAVVLQKPEHRHLAALKREGTAALDRPLRNDILRRALISSLPALAAYGLTLPIGRAEARTVAFASIVATQLTQALDIGRSEGVLTRPVLGAVAGSTALLIASLILPPLRDLLHFVTPSLGSWLILGASAASALLLSRLCDFWLTERQKPREATLVQEHSVVSPKIL